LTCNFDDLELGLFKIIQGTIVRQRSWCQSVSYLTSIMSNIVSLTVFKIYDAEVLWPTGGSRMVQGHAKPIDSHRWFPIRLLLNPSSYLSLYWNIWRLILMTLS